MDEYLVTLKLKKSEVTVLLIEINELIERDEKYMKHPKVTAPVKDMYERHKEKMVALRDKILDIQGIT